RHDRGITIQQEADMKRRLNFGPALRLATSLIGATCIGASVQAQSPADNYPDKPIKFIVPFAPGGSVDVLARAVGAQMQENWGQPVIIESRPGASTMIGT